MDFVFSPEAREDLNDIWDYIAEDNVDAADKVRDKIFDACEMLVRMPEIGHVRQDLVPLPVRFWPVLSYLIVYRSESKPLQIVRVLSGYRDIQALLI